MKLNYDIIWIDDSPDWVASIREGVEDCLDECGFEQTIETLESGENLEETLKSGKCDLLIMDLHLPGDNGDVLLDKLKWLGSFTEIIFYSEEPDKLPDALETYGIHICERESAAEKIEQVIGNAHRKLSDLVLVRGLMIASAIDVEVVMEDFLESFFEPKGKKFREGIMDRGYLDCQKKLVVLRDFLADFSKSFEDDKNSKALIEEVIKDSKSFEKEVLDQRNICAHSKPVSLNGKTVLKGVNSRTKSLTFTPEWLNTVRVDVRKHLRNLRRLDLVLKK